MVITLEELLQRYAVGERDFSRIKVILGGRLAQLDDWDLKGIDLSGGIFRDSNLQDIVLWMHGINLSEADLRYVDLAYARLYMANLSGVNLDSCCLWRANFYHANLSGANLSRTDLQETKFTSTNLSGCNFSGAKILEARFGRANLTDADFRNSKKIFYVDFSKANLTRTNFLGVDSDEILRAISQDAYFQDTIMPDGTILSSVI